MKSTKHLQNLVCFIFIAATFFTACTSAEKDETYDVTKKYEELGGMTKPEVEANITLLEKQLFDSTTGFNQQKTADLMQSYLKYTSIFINDPLVPEYLFKAAGIARSVKLPIKSVELYMQLVKEYPEYEKKAEAMFLVAFVYDNDLNQKEKAKSVYNDFIAKYPTNQLANDAKERLKTIDMTDEEMIKMFEEKNKFKSDSAI